MFVYRITDARSGATVFDHEDADELTVTRTGILYSDVFLGPKDTWTVKIDGIALGSVTLWENNTSPLSTITIGRTGSVVAGIVVQSAATVNNYGRVFGSGAAITLQRDVTHTIVNSGTIAGKDYSIKVFGLGADVVTNRGTLSGTVDLGDGAGTLTNSGKIFGDVVLGGGDDVFTNHIGKKGGLVTKKIDLGAGDDEFYGGSKAEYVSSSAGSDDIDFGRGNDVYFASVQIGDGANTIKGGAGIDTFDASGMSSSVIINLDTIGHTNDGKDIGANTATGLEINNTSLVYDFENAWGGGGVDTIYGSAANNDLSGGDLADQLFGLGGNDSLDGGGGPYIDTLTGGLGADTLRGGYGADKFVFNDIKESGVKPSKRDVIMDFKLGGEADKIVLSGIDLDPKLAGRQGFHIDTTIRDTFDGTSGSLRVRFIPAGPGEEDTLIEGDANGDGKADFAILLKGRITIFPTDFEL